ncbi:MAG TPA: diadenylate cyclase [Longimicrobium sp.]|nr:diadenylate cyclase [Longimicrobium sp.]
MTEKPEYVASVWPYEMHFAISAEVTAEHLFRRLDRAFDPKILLIAIPFGENPDTRTHLIQRDTRLDEDLFQDILPDALAISDEHPDRVYHSDARLQGQHDETILRRSIAEAVNNRLASVASDEVVCFCSVPADVLGFQGVYLVSVILLLQRVAFERHHALIRDRVDERYHVVRSLQHGTVQVYLRGCTIGLSEPNPGHSTQSLRRPGEELLRESAKELIGRIAFEAGGINGVHFLIEWCNTISTLRYEGSVGRGSLIVAEKNHPHVEVLVRLAEPIALSNVVAARKLLQTTSAHVSLVSDSESIYGLGRVTEGYGETAEDLFTIVFLSQHEWQLQHGQKPLMVMRYGTPQLPQSRLDKQTFVETVDRVFPALPQVDVEVLWTATEAALTQEHGTMLVVAANAREEAARLRSQGMPILPVQLSPETFRLLTGIDGALLLDPLGTCHAVGVILDGRASDRGDPSRGARYNSAVRYVESNSEPVLAIVVSEDGRVDVVSRV